MKRIILLGVFLLGLVSASFAAWDPTRPTNDEYKYMVPSVIRDNWDAIAIGTDPALLINNAKVAANAGIVDTKLATISTANKVDGTALFGLANISSGAGVIPAANLPTDNIKLTGDQTVAGVKTFSSSPIVPTPTTNYQAATKKYVDDNPGVPSGVILMWSGSIATIPSGWYLCDGTNGTPDLRDKFIVGAGSTYSVGGTGGEATHTLTNAEMPPHTHNILLGDNAAVGSLSLYTDVNDGGSQTTSSTGGGAPHNNLPPYYALAYIMKS